MKIKSTWSGLTSWDLPDFQMDQVWQYKLITNYEQMKNIRKEDKSPWIQNLINIIHPIGRKILKSSSLLPKKGREEYIH